MTPCTDTQITVVNVRNGAYVNPLRAARRPAVAAGRPPPVYVISTIEASKVLIVWPRCEK
jgi:hypothetical protein